MKKLAARDFEDILQVRYQQILHCQDDRLMGYSVSFQ